MGRRKKSRMWRGGGREFREEEGEGEVAGGGEQECEGNIYIIRYCSAFNFWLG